MLTRSPKSGTLRYLASLQAQLPVLGVSLGLVSLLTAALSLASVFADVEHVTIIYLIP